MTRTMLLMGVLFLAGQASGQEVVVSKSCSADDPSAIRWFLPPSFDEAREAARKNHRILVIKGISFGVDSEGAQCATKGTW